ncbi:ribokinase [Acinetobacter sp. MB5]|uniref:ribokinase n=1 Tax=Acinetobacter sp. MB5 TaxID=2069438 RepID=UPI000DD01EBE|nr:ribokinase [Acinetobacter sp. MB5]
MTNNNKQLVVLGSINVDHILNVAAFPQAGQTITGQHYQLAFGGKGANQAVAASRSGANTTFIACLGNDAIADDILMQFTQDGIDIQSVHKVPEQTTGVALIFVNREAENCIGIFSGANACLDKNYVQKHADHIRQADALLLQLETPLDSLIEAAKIAKSAGKMVVLNPAPAQTLPTDFLQQIDLITPNETEASQLTGIQIKDTASAEQAAQILHDKGIPNIIITLGEHGIWLSQNGQGQHIPAFKVHATDTTGAGDTFMGALMTALFENQTLLKASYFASAAAALAVTQAGAQPSIPWRTEIDEFLKLKKPK